MKLATKFMVILPLLAIISLALIGWLVYANSWRTIEQNNFDRLASVAELKAEAYSRWLETSQRSLKLLARRSLVRQYAAELMSLTPADPAYQALYHELVGDRLVPQIEEGVFLSLSILRGRDGLILASTDASQEGQS